MPEPAILILAAGAATRMRGGDKLLELIDGEALLTRIARAALATGWSVTVALPPDRPGRGAALAGLNLRAVTVPDPGPGMAASLVAGLRAMPAGPVMLLLADLPEITADDLIQMVRAHQDAPELIHRGTAADGTPGHPVIFPGWTRPELLRLEGDQGARAVIRQHSDRLRLTALPGAHATTDLDTPEAWAEWRALRGE
ncbi:nucleotidyltransferase family protein [Tabrizicola fusiformis]|uniref:nucleotidyltransferase family protein n=1 Tax=Tabrizicola sp. SY72 TaxID=2741673 RepID=UPI0015716CFE|nr:nucleotidyltransferase family protein [Tabrizicola sp. SY72]NTT85129.1 nucleotidyltransferase family protein [Tabrizicola sp. SY72]